MASYYAAPLDAVIETMIPAAVRRGAALKRRTLLSAGRKGEAEELAALAKRAPQQARLYHFLAQQVRPQPKGRFWPGCGCRRKARPP